MADCMLIWFYSYIFYPFRILANMYTTMKRHGMNCSSRVEPKIQTTKLNRMHHIRTHDLDLIQKWGKNGILSHFDNVARFAGELSQAKANFVDLSIIYL